MSRYALRPRARADLADIWSYTASQWGVDQAETYIRQIRSAVEAVAANPGLGKSCDEVRAGYRRYPAGMHLLFYKLSSEGVDVIRILHRRMDFERHL